MILLKKQSEGAQQDPFYVLTRWMLRECFPLWRNIEYGNMASEGLSTKGRDRDGELVLSVSCESWESVNPESCGGIIKYISGYNKIKGYGVLAKKKKMESRTQSEQF